VTALGRYLDSLCDLATNAAIFAALGYATGRPLHAGLAFACLTLVLSANFNLERLARGGAAMPATNPASTTAGGGTRRGSSASTTRCASGRYASSPTSSRVGAGLRERANREESVP
jgi:hypothetical protein